MKEIDSQVEEQSRIKEDIMKNLDLIQGSVNEVDSGATVLTYKVDTKDEKGQPTQVTETKYVPKEHVDMVSDMKKNHDEVKELIKKLSLVNYRLVELGHYK
jgi:hypothetical protein